MSGLARGGRRRRTDIEEEEEVMVEQMKESSEEMAEVVELVNNKLPDSPSVISNAVEISMREENADSIAIMKVAAVGVFSHTSVAKNVRMREGIVGGKEGELTGEKETGSLVDGREILSSNHLTWRQRRKGWIPCLSHRVDCLELETLLPKNQFNEMKN